MKSKKKPVSTIKFSSLNEKETLPPAKFTKEKCNSEIEKFRKKLYELQNIFYADGRYALLIILQGMDSSGKDSTIRKVMTSMNPMGVNVKSFVRPSEEEMKHDFLWRIYPHIPAKGMIEVFNRSHYEDILVPFVNKTLDEQIIHHRCMLMNQLEQHFMINNILVLKFFFNISHDEQKKRIKERQTKIHKRWKFNINDNHSSEKWESYMKGYELIMNNCNQVPWHIIPSDKKWYRNYIVAKTITETMEKLGLKYPE
jgi:PPK2 family polyphosphate:nucleotide phosphotransferase